MISVDIAIAPGLQVTQLSPGYWHVSAPSLYKYLNIYVDIQHVSASF